MEVYMLTGTAGEYTLVSYANSRVAQWSRTGTVRLLTQVLPSYIIIILPYVRRTYKISPQANAI
jgi:hypothetical protein